MACSVRKVVVGCTLENGYALEGRPAAPGLGCMLHPPGRRRAAPELYALLPRPFCLPLNTLDTTPPSQAARLRARACCATSVPACPTPLPCPHCLRLWRAPATPPSPPLSCCPAAACAHSRHTCRCGHEGGQKEAGCAAVVAEHLFLCGAKLVLDPLQRATGHIAPSVACNICYLN